MGNIKITVYRLRIEAGDIIEAMNDDFRKNIVSMYGDAGKKWLDLIPDIINEYEEKWSFHALPPYSLSYNYVAPVIVQDGSEAVLKIGFPGDKEFRQGALALKVFNGEGTVKLLNEDLEKGVILLEKLEPGENLLSLSSDQEATRIATGVMKKLWRKPSDDFRFPYVSDWGKGFMRHREKFNGTSGPLPQKLFDHAEKTFVELEKSMAEKVLLHGDLHQANILSSHRAGWLAIDPKGVIGERAYEVGSLLRNPKQLATNPNLPKILGSRIAILSEELRISKERIIGWGMSQAVLSAVWSVEDHRAGFEDAITFAKHLQEMM